MGAHIVRGEFQSDKYSWCAPGFVPLKLTDPMAQPLLWEYAAVRRSVDSEFSDDLEACLKKEGFAPPLPGGPVVYSLKEGSETKPRTTIALSVATVSGWVRVELDWASLLAKRFDGNLTQKESKALSARVQAVIEKAQEEIASIHDEFRKASRDGHDA
jgi:hypothetical protein